MHDVPSPLCEEQAGLQAEWETRVARQHELAERVRDLAGRGKPDDLRQARFERDGAIRSAAEALQMLMEHKRQHGCL